MDEQERVCFFQSGWDERRSRWKCPVRSPWDKVMQRLARNYGREFNFISDLDSTGLGNEVDIAGKYMYSTTGHCREKPLTSQHHPSEHLLWGFDT